MVGSPSSERSATRKASRWSGLRRVEARLLMSLLGVLAMVWGFLALTDEVREGDTSRFDRTLLLAFRVPNDLSTPIGPRWLQESARDVTALGGFTVLTLVTAVAFAILMLLGRRTQAWILAGSVVLAQVFAEATKAIVHRPRPDLVPQRDLVYSTSFPSGHALMTPVVYLTLAAIIAAGHPRLAIKAILLIGAAILVVLVGVSRVYLGVHWPSDVLAGWTIGAMIALAASVLLSTSAPRQNANEKIEADTPPVVG
jgi:undecaprenyl-diphosphatase